MKNSKNKLRSLLLILGLVIVGAVVWFVYNTIQFGNCIGDCEETPLVTETASTEGWKTYTNTEYGFSFKYPSSKDYTLDDSCSRNHDYCPRGGAKDLINISGKDRMIFWINQSGIAGGLYNLEIDGTYSQSELEKIYTFTTLEQYNNFFRINKEDSRFSTSTFAGETAYVFRDGGSASYSVHHGHNNFEIGFDQFEESEQDVVKEILASFRFTQ